MKNKKILLGMLVIALVFGMLVSGCNKDSEDDSNPYIGEWSSQNFKLKKLSAAEITVDASISFTDTTWVINAGEINIEGTYTKGTLQATLFETKDGAPYRAGTAQVVLNNLTVTFDTGTYNGSSGSFTKPTPPPAQTDPLKGTWTGSLKKGSGTNADTATVTINFTDDNKWTVTETGSSTTKTQSGTYKKSTSYSGSLYTSADAGPISTGSYVINPFKNPSTLTVTITYGTYKDYSGSEFTRTTTAP